VLAGGTDLLVQMRSLANWPRRIVDLKRVPELTRIEVDADVLRIGAAVPAVEIVEHAQLRALIPGLVEATDLIGSTQIQGRATLGGNLCNASPAADTVPAMIVLGATCVVVGPGGERTVPVAEIATAPGQTSLSVGEFVSEIMIARPPAGSGDAYLRLIPRSEMDIAIVGAGACVHIDAAGVCSHAQVAIGAVAPTARVVPDAGAALLGSSLDEPALERMQEAVRAACDPIDDKRGTVAYRTKVAGVLARRATAIAAERARSTLGGS
jgi:carbon-monoxide dehydrogenase medium subunit